jgi:3-isopropylmalate/(R)-2-methylmalate dehydratase small subunit
MKGVSVNTFIKRRGFCHVFGDNVALSEGIIAFKFSIGRVTDPKELIPHLFERTDPLFVSRVKPGDFVIAGQNFACGKPHPQGFIAMAALDMSVLCHSMPYMSLRGAVSRGLPVLTGCESTTSFAETGDEIEVDFATGDAINLSRGTRVQLPPMPLALREIVSQGGSNGRLQAWLDAHPDQMGAVGDPSAPQVDKADQIPLTFVKAQQRPLAS